MPRRAEITPRALLRDPVYESVLVTQVVNRVMQDGKKSVKAILDDAGVEVKRFARFEVGA